MKKIEKFGPLQSPDYATRLMSNLSSQIETEPRERGISYKPKRLSDLVHPNCDWAWKSIKDKNKLHRYAEHIRSSQTFAVNLFGGLPQMGIRELLAAFFGPIDSVELPVFEFEDENDFLRESVQQGQRTQVDVLLRGRTRNQREVALLVEVKLSETDFGQCSGATDPLNDSLSICETSGAFGNDYVNCFKLRNHGKSERRTYDKYLEFAGVNQQSAFQGCWFRTSAYQPMRNVALANVMKVEYGIDTRVVVCAPLLHRNMWLHFQNAQQVLPVDSIYALPAEVVLALHAESTFDFIRDRYFPSISEDEGSESKIEIATWKILSALDQQFEHNFRIFETHPGGGTYNCVSLFETVENRPHLRVDLNRNGRIHVHSLSGESLEVFDWDDAMAGNVNEIAVKIGQTLGLPIRTDFSNARWLVFQRIIELGVSAGETLFLRNFVNESSSLVGTEHFLGDWIVERRGDVYAESGFPTKVFGATASKQVF